MPGEYLTPQELATRLGVAVRTLNDMRYRGTGPRFLRTGATSGRVRYRLADVLEWERKHTVEPKAAGRAS